MPAVEVRETSIEPWHAVSKRVLVLVGLHRGALFHSGVVVAITPQLDGGYLLDVEGIGEALGRQWTNCNPKNVIEDNLEPEAA